ncbi:N-6 DNA methylase [Oscillochloris sp. ZM17-4]|uniref:N-6 DNA methylase n=1 Tax=Oscillochloris sp. ZM17-4 TaxID=2866714 RepID=UPI001C730053|nr:N-6 DNA methylase [Oscillochloris sp. ZM17-4]MBX0327751.1 N-6 DNA methylase [Oscillochloris sp. ZM17-4]
MPPIQPAHKAIAAYYTTLADLSTQGIVNEGGLRRAFSLLLATLGRAEGWILAEEQTLAGRIRPDGVLLDEFRFPRGHWEAKDSADDLEVEIRKKFERGYPQSNIIFEDGRRAVLVQNRRRSAEADMSDRVQLATLLAQFFGHTEANVEGFQAAVREFQARIPDLAGSVEQIIEEARRSNQRFAAAFDAFHTICRQAIDPNISADEIEKMLVQHLLTERLFRTVFDDPDFTRRNVIADEIEKVIRSLTWNRSEFLRRLDPFYTAIEEAAKGITEYAEKQTFLNTVYERFFQGYSREQADTHGVVYTPQPIVDFMVASVDEVLRREFGKSLSDEGVAILDPATGTGNFIVNILRRISRRDLKRKYKQELFANEIMLLPYYIASLNIEHTYQELTGEYAPFEGICFTDTLDLAESQQLSLFAEENTERVERQKQAQITVIIGNPPYNFRQVNENDNNKNKRYSIIDEKIRATYAKDSQSSNKIALYDAYVKFFRWSTDRLRGSDGIVCFISNNNFIHQTAFDGMRKNLLRDFTQIYHVDLHGDVRRNPKLSGSTHNVFGIQVGVGITVMIKSSIQKSTRLMYYRMPNFWRKEEKLADLERFTDNGVFNRTIPWGSLVADDRGSWLVPSNANEFGKFIASGSKEAKSTQARDVKTVFKTFSLGLTVRLFLSAVRTNAQPDGALPRASRWGRPGCMVAHMAARQC